MFPFISDYTVIMFIRLTCTTTTGFVIGWITKEGHIELLVLFFANDNFGN